MPGKPYVPSSVFQTPVPLTLLAPCRRLNVFIELWRHAGTGACIAARQVREGGWPSEGRCGSYVTLGMMGFLAGDGGVVLSGF